MYALTSTACLICFYQRHTFYQALDSIIDHADSEHPSTSKCPKMLSFIDRDRQISLKEYQPWKPVQIRGITHGFFIGFFVSLIPGGVAADMYGAKITMAAGVALSTISTVMFPTLAELGPTVSACGRLLQGMSQGLVFPATSAVTAQWAPITERTIATGIIYGGQFFGWTLAYLMHLEFYEFSLDWVYQFYVCGALGLIWLIFWTIFAFSKPSDCSYIKELEVEKINKSSEEYDRKIAAMPRFIPWKEIVSSCPLHALIIINFAGAWSHYILLQYFKFYLMNFVGLSHGLSYDSVELAHCVLAISTVFWALPSDWLVNHDYMSRTTCRKLFAFTSNVSLIPCMVGILWSGCQGLTVVCIYVTICFLRGPFYVSLRANVVDLNPHFAGILNGIVHCTGCIVALFSWDSFSLIVGDTSDVTQWRNLFVLLSTVLLFLSLPYLWFGSAKVQPWGLSKLQPRDVT